MSLHPSPRDPSVAVRPMTAADAPAVHELAVAAFNDLDERLGRPLPPPPATPEAAYVRFRHLVSTDPDGAVVAERDGQLLGACLALIREGIWGLSMLAVRPGAQSGRIGSSLLSRALEYGASARGGIILSSDDPRAMRAYARAGFALHPTVAARGRPRTRPDRPDGVRDGAEEDLALTEVVDRAVRGGARAMDVAAAMRAGRRLLVAEGRGYAIADRGKVSMLAALDDGAAADLVRAAAASAPAGEPVSFEFATAAQGWAVAVALELEMDLLPWGPLFLRGELGPLRPYLPGGAYL